MIKKTLATAGLVVVLGALSTPAFADTAGSSYDQVTHVVVTTSGPHPASVEVNSCVHDVAVAHTGDDSDNTAWAAHHGVEDIHVNG